MWVDVELKIMQKNIVRNMQKGTMHELEQVMISIFFE